MDFAAFKSGMKQNFALDLDSYKEAQLKRRLETFLARHKTDYGAYFRQLLANKASFKEFVDFLTINVSEFFRDPKLFAILETEVLPRLLAGRGGLRIWSAACSIGAEPYSLAILLEELAPGRRHQILATDIDQQILQAARTAAYGPESLRNVGTARLARFFTQEDEHKRTLVDGIKKKVEFRQHNLLKDPFERDFDLIACRNVLIYFTREAQNDLFLKFSRALTPGGFLFIGGSEMIFRYRELGLDKVTTCMYTRVGNRDI
ncbi:MAG: protein-glutamate O-methyltransferase CheR [Peptococcaceae bacterium]|jgi:chemotaxis protein methyltransferase CheR|nr:protein-glutamate O-methyltransferase CheR [Peptococcaceae bacterium]